MTELLPQKEEEEVGMAWRHGKVGLVGGKVDNSPVQLIRRSIVILSKVDAWCKVDVRKQRAWSRNLEPGPEIQMATPTRHTPPPHALATYS